MYRFSVISNIILIVLINLVLAGVSFSAEKKVLVFPFKIDGPTEYQYLSKEIPSLVGVEIKRGGGKLIDAGSFKYSSSRDLYKLASEKGASSFLTGKFSVKGNDIFSLDVELGVLKDKKVYTIAENFKGIENLFSVVNNISGVVGNRLFKKIKIIDIEIRGNERIESDAIKRVLTTKKGTIYADDDLSEDLENIYKMGYFGDIRARKIETGKGVKVVFDVVEKPTIKQIYVRGNNVYEDEKVKENLSLKSGSILNIFDVKKDIEAIKELYREKNYHQVEVSYELNELSHNRADVVFMVAEGKKTFIEEIRFEGNDDYKDKVLKKKIESSEKGFFSWLTGSGEYKKDQIEQDKGRLLGFYYTTGYAEARVSDPEIKFDGSKVFVVFKISEGDKFEIGDVKAAGDLIISEEAILSSTKTTKGDVYNREIIHKDVLAISDIFANSGYANARVVPDIKKSEDGEKLNITFNIEKNNKVYIDRIIVTGNTKTRDKVIRREFPIKEQSLYSKARLQRGVKNLYRMDYFGKVDMETVPSEKEDKVDIHVNVEEKTTGMFTFGAGYSSVDNLFATVSVSQRNFLGKGQTLNLKGTFGGKATKYTLSFTEPWLFDMPLSAGFDVYNWEKEYDDYDKKSVGGSIRLGYPIFDYTRFYWSYTYEVATIDDIETTDPDILEIEGRNVESSTSISIKYDSRDRMFNPTEGMKHKLTIEHAGGPIGGDYSFTKYTAESGVYLPLFWDFVFFVHGEVGYVHKNGDGLLPDYEKFKLGGMNSVRGYDWQDINIRTKSADGKTTYESGGDKYLQGNFEIIFPLVKSAGLMGLCFFDVGDVFATDDSLAVDDLKKSWGYGIRWFSPVGPIRLEYGRMLDPVGDDKEDGRWEFTMGQAF